MSKKEFKRKKGKYSRIVCLTLPLQTRKKLYKIITIPSVKKVIEKDLKLTISEKSLKNIEKKIEIIVHKPTTLIIPYVLTDMKKKCHQFRSCF